MHERGLVRRLLAQVDEQARRAGLSRVDRVQVELGALAELAPAALRLHFEAAARETAAAHALLVIDSVPAQARCPACAARVTLLQRATPCPHCQAWPLTIESGESLRLVALEGV